jgi:hypothetical protein
MRFHGIQQDSLPLREIRLSEGVFGVLEQGILGIGEGIVLAERHKGDSFYHLDDLMLL